MCNDLCIMLIVWKLEINIRWSKQSQKALSKLVMFCTEISVETILFGGKMSLSVLVGPHLHHVHRSFTAAPPPLSRQRKPSIKVSNYCSPGMLPRSPPECKKKSNSVYI